MLLDWRGYQGLYNCTVASSCLFEAKTDFFEMFEMLCFQDILREMDSKGKVDKKLLAEVGVDLS